MQDIAQSGLHGVVQILPGWFSNKSIFSLKILAGIPAKEKKAVLSYFRPFFRPLTKRGKSLNIFLHLGL
jgi:hypothetical protein